MEPQTKMSSAFNPQNNRTDRINRTLKLRLYHLQNSTLAGPSEDQSMYRSSRGMSTRIHWPMKQTQDLTDLEQSNLIKSIERQKQTRPTETNSYRKRTGSGSVHIHHIPTKLAPKWRGPYGVVAKNQIILNSILYSMAVHSLEPTAVPWLEYET
eukprot:superscaffoldBa00007544_g22633